MTLFDAIRQRVRRRAIKKEIARIRQITVGEIMTKYVITIKAEEEVIRAATKMIAEDISCLVVIKGENTPTGVLSERDFLKKVPLNGAVFNMKVKDIMSPNLTTVLPTMKIPDAVALMKEKGFRRLVVAENNVLLGVVTQTDFTKTINKFFVSYPEMQKLSIGSLMTKQVLSVTPKNNVAQAKEKMLKIDVGAIIIVDEKNKNIPLGIFTEYDVVMQFYDQHGKLQMNNIEKYMRKYVRAMPAQASIFAANKLMLEKNMRRILVVDGEKIIGILTQTDICRFIYPALDMIEKIIDEPDIVMKRFSAMTEIHGEFRGEHLKVYVVG